MTGGPEIPERRLIDGTTAFFTFTTAGYVPFVRNLHASLRRHDPALADHLMVFCPDARTERELVRRGMFAIRCDADALPEFAEFDGPGFGRVVSYKFLLARVLLRQARYAWWCDGDIVVNAPLLDRVGSLVRHGEADLLMQYEWPAAAFNTGFWVARRSDAVDEMLQDVAERTARTNVDDQTVFNERHAAGGRLRIETFDPYEFRCGNLFYYRHLVRRPDGRLLHFNYTVGKASKRSLMIGHGCWNIEEPRSTRWVAKARHIAVALGLRLGVDLTDEGTAVETLDPRERLLQAVGGLKRLLARVAARPDDDPPRA